MPIANYTTGEAVSSSLTKVFALLVKAGASEIRTRYEGEIPTGIAFEIKTEFGIRAFELPVRVEGVHRVLNADRRVEARYRKREHAARVAWRIAYDWLRAQLALIESGLAPMDEVLFPYMLVSGQTTFERYTVSQKEISQ